MTTAAAFGYLFLGLAIGFVITILIACTERLTITYQRTPDEPVGYEADHYARLAEQMRDKEKPDA